MLTIQTNLPRVAENQYQNILDTCETQLEFYGIFHGDATGVEMPNLYVYSGGESEIEFAEDLQDHEYVTMAPVRNYRSVEELLSVMERNYAPDKEVED